MDAATFQREAAAQERLLWHIAYAILRKEEDCADAIQTALLRAWQNRGSLREMGAFRSWLCRILTNTCKEMLKKRNREFTEELTGEIPFALPDQVERIALADALSRLSPEMRLCVTCHYLDGWKIPEIAEALGIPEGTVKTRLMHARHRLGEWLREES